MPVTRGQQSRAGHNSASTPCAYAIISILLSLISSVGHCSDDVEFAQKLATTLLKDDVVVVLARMIESQRPPSPIRRNERNEIIVESSEMGFFGSHRMPPMEVIQPIVGNLIAGDRFLYWNTSLLFGHSRYGRDYYLTAVIPEGLMIHGHTGGEYLLIMKRPPDVAARESDTEALEHLQRSAQRIQEISRVHSELPLYVGAMPEFSLPGPAPYGPRYDGIVLYAWPIWLQLNASDNQEEKDSLLYEYALTYDRDLWDEIRRRRRLYYEQHIHVPRAEIGEQLSIEPHKSRVAAIRRPPMQDEAVQAAMARVALDIATRGASPEFLDRRHDCLLILNALQNEASQPDAEDLKTAFGRHLQRHLLNRKSSQQE